MLLNITTNVSENLETLKILLSLNCSTNSINPCTFWNFVEGYESDIKAGKNSKTSTYKSSCKGVVLENSRALLLTECYGADVLDGYIKKKYIRKVNHISNIYPFFLYIYVINISFH